jgi:hypothetical protein
MQHAYYPPKKRMQATRWLHLVNLDLPTVHSGTLSHALPTRVFRKSWRCFQLTQYTLVGRGNSSPSLYKKSRDSSVDIVTCYSLHDWGSIPGRSKIFSSRTALGPTKSLIQWVSGVISLGVKGPRLEAGHSPPSSAEVKNGGAIPSLCIRLHDVVVNLLSTRTLPFLLFSLISKRVILLGGHNAEFLNVKAGGACSNLRAVMV